ncbi:acyl-CoA dehydrogenase family protein [Castellaniella sp.]|uniref:acyl-CoA dehydrogenase family protein n=1 Tax=Castellaniella sp. TaxID=1955812 RepID=UPI00355FD125
MDFNLSEEQTLIVETAERIGREFGPQYWADLDRQQAFPAECWQAICDAGLAGAALPEAYGGAGQGMTEVALIVEALAAGGGGATLGQLFMTNPIFGGVSISKFGSAEMKQALLPRLIRGDMHFCMALTEPDSGTNTLAMKSFARPDGDGWRLKGQKIWITMVEAAQKMLVVARTRKPDEVARRSEGISMFMIDIDREGLSHTAIDKVGTRTLSASSVFFDDVRIEPEELVGTLHHGFQELLDVLNTERIVTTACMVGAGRLAMRLALDYAGQRKVFGDRPISAYQGLQFPLAQAHAELECARLMNLQSAWRCDNGLPYGSQANVAKLIGSQAATHAIERSMQTMGGMGFSKEFHVERLWRDARLFKFAPISEEMVLNYIAIHDLGMPRSY